MTLARPSMSQVASQFRLNLHGTSVSYEELVWKTQIKIKIQYTTTEALISHFRWIEGFCLLHGQSLTDWIIDVRNQGGGNKLAEVTLYTNTWSSSTSEADKNVPIITSGLRDSLMCPFWKEAVDLVNCF